MPSQLLLKLKSSLHSTNLTNVLKIKFVRKPISFGLDFHFPRWVENIASRQSRAKNINFEIRATVKGYSTCTLHYIRKASKKIIDFSSSHRLDALKLTLPDRFGDLKWKSLFRCRS